MNNLVGKNLSKDDQEVLQEIVSLLKEEPNGNYGIEIFLKFLAFDEKDGTIEQNSMPEEVLTYILDIFRDYLEMRKKICELNSLL